MRLQWSAILARKGHFMATPILNCLDGVGDEIESELRSNRVSFAQRAANGVEAISSTLSTLPILIPDLFGEFAGRKNRIQNYCEQDDPTSCRHDREDQAASPRH
jgi:hypothetical protein